MTTDTSPSTIIDLRPADPLWLRVSKRLQRAGVRGGFRLERVAGQRLWPHHRGVAHQLTPSLRLVVPIGARSFDRHDVDRYEQVMLGQVASLVSRLPGPVTLIDCGADFGLVSGKLVARCPSIDRVACFEPNPEVFDFLDLNVDSWDLDGQAIKAAVADWAGRGELRNPPFDSSPHAAYLAPADDGPIRVTTLDALDLPAGNAVVVKIDVEGGERAVVRGAARLLASAADFVVVFEAHPRQTERTGIDPMEVVAELRRIRPCHAVVGERPDLALSADRRFRDQVGDDLIYNICVSTVAS